MRKRFHVFCNQSAYSIYLKPTPDGLEVPLINNPEVKTGFLITKHVAKEENREISLRSSKCLEVVVGSWFLVLVCFSC